MMLKTAMTGTQRLNGNLTKIDNTLRARSLRLAVQLGSKPIQHSLKQLASVDTGTLKRSQQTKVKTYRKGQVAVAVTGARNRKYKNGRNPAKYSHLVANGFRTRSGGFVAGTDYVRKAAGISMPMARSITTNVLKTESELAARQVVP